MRAPFRPRASTARARARGDNLHISDDTRYVPRAAQQHCVARACLGTMPLARHTLSLARSHFLSVVVVVVVSLHT